MTRTVHPLVPPNVDYTLTAPGMSLGAAVCGVWVWAAENLKHAAHARHACDEKQAAAG